MMESTQLEVLNNCNERVMYWSSAFEPLPCVCFCGCARDVGCGVEALKIKSQNGVESCLDSYAYAHASTDEVLKIKYKIIFCVCARALIEILQKSVYIAAHQSAHACGSAAQHAITQGS